ncbi:Putative UDP-rhamnose:rhamnosyltransferase 1 [Apostasia shenzhenica]|uniref:UDP-rhamnose:rhamnosyltransferase 1 n=1 Tax=Apostasia shenzhenica TaxID=1088818 RepID=A0A2I0BG77_9ASPA|nr:Putative UDP-rhamnose:rhamnosyltransferase 1 [Apostasia shenzhenica]
MEEAPDQAAESRRNTSAMDSEPIKLHVVMLPWLAMGHLFPFFELSKRLALLGHRVSFLASPANLRRLPVLPPSLSQLLELVPCPLPPVENLPENVESTVDLPSDDVRPMLTQAFFSFEGRLAEFLDDPSRPKPDWIIYDMIANNWVPALAARHRVSCAYFGLFNAAILCFFGKFLGYDSPKQLTVVPEWIPLPTTVVFTPFEARQIFPMLPKGSSSDQSRALRGSFMAIRTCRVFEPEWLDLLGKIHVGYPIVPVGFLPPSFDDGDSSQTWVRISAWLDQNREPGSVVFAAFGSEVKLTLEQIEEIAAGLERSEVPFLWALRAGSPPAGFADRTGGRGLVVEGWVPQARLLAHESVGGFLTHGGWNSIVEGLTAGVALVVLPMQFEQGLNARLLEEKGLGFEVVRGREDGLISGEEIARKLRAAMAEEEDGEGLRARARKGKERFGGEEMQGKYMEEFVKHLWENRGGNCQED